MSAAEEQLIRELKKSYTKCGHVTSRKCRPKHVPNEPYIIYNRNRIAFRIISSLNSGMFV
jgi:hypothetical protein